MRLAATIIAASLATLATTLAPDARAQTPEASSSTVVTFTNELPKSYRLTRVRLVVDGAVRYDGAKLDAASIPSGNHVVEVVADYRMHSSLFSYLDRMGIQVRSAHVVHPVNRRVNARAVPHGGATTPLQRSAVISWVDR